MSLLKCKNLQNFKYFANPKKCRFVSIVRKIYLIIIVSKFYERSVAINLEFAFVCATPCFCQRHDGKKGRFAFLMRNSRLFKALNLGTSLQKA